MLDNYKWRFAIGTTSRVPKMPGKHYVILDIDGPKLPSLINQVACFAYPGIKIYKTEHGWHVYTNMIVSWRTLPNLLLDLGADPSWVKIGRRRGYFFLADKKQAKLPWPVERMCLSAKKGKGKEVNTSRA